MIPNIVPFLPAATGYVPQNQQARREGYMMAFMKLHSELRFASKSVVDKDYVLDLLERLEKEVSEL